MSEKILMIETSTECCSVALADGAQILASRINGTPRQHAAMLAPYVQEVLAECGLAASGLDAVAVSEGPGSYTGLRVGVSTAKGLCFGAGKPLLGIDTLQILAMQALAEGRFDRIVAMIDARRMEVYAASFDASARKVSETQAATGRNWRPGPSCSSGPAWRNSSASARIPTPRSANARRWPPPWYSPPSPPCKKKSSKTLRTLNPFT